MSESTLYKGRCSRHGEIHSQHPGEARTGTVTCPECGATVSMKPQNQGRENFKDRAIKKA